MSEVIIFYRSLRNSVKNREVYQIMKALLKISGGGTIAFFLFSLTELNGNESILVIITKCFWRFL